MDNKSITDPVIITSLIAAITGLAGFVAWVVKTILGLYKENVTVITEVKSSVDNNTKATEKCTDVSQTLYEYMLKGNK